MFKKISFSTLTLLTLVSSPSQALSLSIPAGDDYTSCVIHVAVSTPPLRKEDRVIFNVSDELRKINFSTTLSGGSDPSAFSNLICTDVPYTVSATLYSVPSNFVGHNKTLGLCTLKAEKITLNQANSNAWVVFPGDFNCNLG